MLAGEKTHQSTHWLVDNLRPEALLDMERQLLYFVFCQSRKKITVSAEPILMAAMYG